MAAVLVFLLGMPLLAVPQVSEYLRWELAAKPRGPVVIDERPIPRTVQATRERGSKESSEIRTMLAAKQSQPIAIQPDPDALAATIEALRAQFIAEGVSYMVLEQIGANSAKYRFRFDVPVAEGSNYRKRFEIVDEAPDEAMRRALTELQQWRVAGREPDRLDRPTVILR